VLGAYPLTIAGQAAEARTVWLTGGQESDAFDLTNGYVPPSRVQVAGQYLVLGFEHIVPKGVDHILFVLGIFLLSTAWRPIFLQITTFTIAHSITLGLTIYGLVSLPSSIVEPMIALSITYVAIENLFTSSLRPWRLGLVFAFGLLHGMGFAGVLKDLGLPRSEFLTALVTFNLGVEGGQLAVIVMALIAVGWWRRAKAPTYRRWIVVPASLLIAAVGAYWTVTRAIG
jgi:hydrogenase/urease accessory protein HupE